MPKSFARLLAEKLALARALLGDDLDLGSGSAIRKLLEVAALEDARTWAALAAIYDNSFVVSATGEALSRLGEELGLPRPFLEANGTVKLKLTGFAAAARTRDRPATRRTDADPGRSPRRARRASRAVRRQPPNAVVGGRRLLPRARAQPRPGRAGREDRSLEPARRQAPAALRATRRSRETRSTWSSSTPRR